MTSSIVIHHARAKLSLPNETPLRFGAHHATVAGLPDLAEADVIIVEGKFFISAGYLVEHRDAVARAEFQHHLITQQHGH